MIKKNQILKRLKAKFFTKLKKRTLVILGILAVIFIGFKLISGRNKIKIQSDIVKKGNVIQTTTLSGTIDAQEKATLQFQMGGLLSWVGVKEGDYVKKYQGIASLDTRDLNLRLNKYLNLYSKTRLDFDQLNYDDKNYLENPSSDVRDRIKRILDKSQYDLDNTVLDVEIQNLAISLSTISSPISGIVTKVGIPFAGINILPTQATFEVVNPNSIYFSVTADQTEVGSIKKDQTVKIILDAFTNEAIEGKVRKIAFIPKVGETGTVYEINIDLNGIKNLDLKYKIGMTGDANFITAEKQDVLYVLPQFIKEDTKGKYLLVGRKKEKVYIETGLEEDNKTEVAGNIKEGDLVYD